MIVSIRLKANLVISRVPNKIFIIGVGRSGTSLLQSMLNAHSSIVAMPETQFFRKYLANNKSRKAIENKGAESFLQILEKDEAFKRLDISISEIDSLQGSSLDLLNVYEEFMHIYATRKAKNIIVDKDPRNLDFVKTIIQLVPNAGIIQIVRDPRDVVLSKTKAKWSSNRPYWLHALIGSAQLKNSAKSIEELDKTQYIQIYYEELLAKPEEVLTKLTSFIGVSFESSMLDFGASANELVSKKEMQWKKETLGPLLISNTEKWKNAFSPKQIAIIEKFSKWSMKKYNYDQSSVMTELSNFSRFTIFIVSQISYTFNLIYWFWLKKR